MSGVRVSDGLPTDSVGFATVEVTTVTRTSPVTGGWSWLLTLVVGGALFALVEAILG